MAQFGDLQVKYRNASEAERSEIQTQWKQLVDKGNVMEPKLLAAAEKAFVEAPNANKDVSDLLLQLCVHYVGSDDYENAYRLGKVLVDHQCQDKRTCNLAGLAALAVGNLDDAEAYLKLAKENNVAGAVGIDLLDDLATRFQDDPAAYKQAWAKEQEIRAAEAKADDLPRVLLKTNKGDIEIELFENEAPNTVANFISLVEKGFYNGADLPPRAAGLHGPGRRSDGQRHAAGRATTSPANATSPTTALHFRGTLSMAHAGPRHGRLAVLPDVPAHPAPRRQAHGLRPRDQGHRRAGEAPAPRPGRHRMPPEPDKIVEAKVLRKRTALRVRRPTKDGTSRASRTLILHHLLLRALARSLALFFVLLGEFLDLFLDAVAVVFGEVFVFLGLVGDLVAVAADVADGDLGLLGQLLDAADHLAPHLGRQRRHVEADHPAVALRVEPQVAGLDRLLDVLDRARIVRADDDLRGLGGADRSDLLDRHRRAVDLDAQRIDQPGVGPAGANARQGPSSTLMAFSMRSSVSSRISSPVMVATPDGQLEVSESGDS